MAQHKTALTPVISGIVISPATPDDIPALCELLEILFTQEAEFHPNREAQQQALTDIINNPESATLLAARLGGQVAGMADLLFLVSTALGGRVALLEDMVVHPAYRNLGIGTRLLHHAVKVARENGCRRITLLTDQSNLEAQDFYRKQGFVLSAMAPMRLLL